MEKWRGRVALVTGASVGIGAAIAKRLVQSGMIVYGCARNVAQIQVRTVHRRTYFALNWTSRRLAQS